MTFHGMGSSSSHAPIAVVVGLSVIGLAVARSLARRGIQVIGVHFGPELPPAAKSRYLRLLVGPDFADTGAVLECLRDLSTRLSTPAVLIPTTDAEVLFVHRHRAEISALFRFYVWNSDLLESLLSKRHLADLARQYELPAPATLALRDQAAVRDAIASLRFPCVIKPESANLWCTDKARACNIFGEKALPVWTSSELGGLYDRLMHVDPRLVVQQMVSGPDANHLEFPAFVGPDGEIRTEFVARKLRLAPAHFGMGCYVESIRSDEVVETGRRILRALGYRGLAMVQFKRDERDGKLYLLEINPRFTVWTSLPVACGVDLPFYYYQASLGKPYSVPTSYAIGRMWWDPVSDVFAMRTYLSDGTWTWWRWVITILRCPTNAYFTWDDPLPGLAAAGTLCRRLIRAFRRRLIRS